MSATNAAMIAVNEKLFAIAKIRPEWQARIDKDAARLVLPANKTWFLEEEKRTQVPWFVVAVTKEREAGPDTGFLRSIAQGDAWNKKSKNVPAGRGPFTNWYEAADDALLKCAPYMGLWRDWSVGGSLTILMKYNGVGYFLRGLPSPYIFAATTAYIKGKFIADHKFDPEFVDQQIGCAALLLAMQKLDPSITFGPKVADPRPTPEPPKEIIDDATKSARTVRKTAIGGVAVAGANEGAKTGTQIPDKAPVPLLPSFAAYSLIGVAVAVAIVATVLVARAKVAVQAIW